MSLRAWLELARLSNAPTVVSNVLVGTALGVQGGGDPSPYRITITAAAVLLLYVAGMALNDVLDAEVDRSERPQRPIPSGRISRRAAMMFVTVCMLTALAMLASIGVPPLIIGAALSATIILYDATHQRAVASVVLLGACRGLTYVLAASTAGWPPSWMLLLVLAASLTTYVVLFSLVARVEVGGLGRAHRWLALAAFVPAFAPLCILFPHEWAWWHVAAIAALTAWLGYAARALLARPPRIGQAIMAWIAGISLLDALYLTLLDQPSLALGGFACFLITIAGHRRIAGT